MESDRQKGNKRAAIGCVNECIAMCKDRGVKESKRKQRN